MWQKQWTHNATFDLVAVGKDGNVRLIDVKSVSLS